ncbi:DUF4132 domain-containing protein [Micromonospora sp. WMMD812]|uniref:DUF4132 domain-containing protein n=1 Tax=Micromonospora sp. WMMD812 TaxID=3015152 RepID=UPI00248C92CD|nr:DUF4132 domain-containing protein [Micromonospora sp. WMMD812]WBB68100.1 DUF4132 domain-containing protein [Micromonospora sp. WMMD812]
MTTLSFYPERVAAVRHHADGDDVAALVAELAEIARLNGGHWGHDGRKVTDVLDALPDDRRARLATALVDHLEESDPGDGASLTALLTILVRHLGPLVSLADARRLLDLAARQWTWWPADQLGVLARLVYKADGTLPGALVGVLRRTVLTGYQSTGALKDLVGKIREPLLNPGEAWADRLLAELPGLGDGGPDLVSHALTATAARPTARWERQAGALLDRVGADTYRDAALGWLALVGRPRTAPVQPSLYGYDVAQAYDPHNATALRGLVWLVALAADRARGGSPDADTARELGRLVETSLRKVPGLGPRNPKVANAAVYALARLDGEHALAQIARLTSRVTYKGTLKELNAALDRRAAALGLSRAEVEELAVPTYGLTAVGRRTETFGAATAELVVRGGAVALRWCNAAGRPVRTAPAAVRRDHPDELRELKAAVKDVEKMLAAQAERLDRQFLARRRWRYDAWRSRYLDHVLVGTLGRRLVWQVDGVPCGYADGALRTVDDTRLTPADDAEVTLWHPIGRDVAEVLGWREWLERHAVVQPFKQAHREVYLLTAAEERTGVYSNRFAAHVLRQHQFHALAAVRGWRNRLRLMVDDTYPPASRELPEWGLRAEYWVEGAGDEYGVDSTDSGAYLRVVTDQVRFYPLDAPENNAHAGGGGYEQWLRPGAGPVAPLPLDQIPPLVLSEVMRDVDLFVGVASIGNDPTWQDGGPAGRYREYWQSYGFGELSATAETRRDLLGRLVPRLAIADRCRVEGRFLVVRGDLRGYQIHLGSGNILMTPNDEYLCIVPQQSAAAGTGEVFLPFEGDRMLGVILSKAMLLARDTEITDPTILSQLRRR